MIRRKIVFDHDSYPDFSWLDQWNTRETYKGNEVLINGFPLSFEEYMRTVGDPDYHVMLDMRVYEIGPDDEDWRLVDSLGGIDFFANGNDWATGAFYRVSALPEGYQRELAREAGLPE